MQLTPHHSRPPSPGHPSTSNGPDESSSANILRAWEAWANETPENANRLVALSRVQACLASGDPSLDLSRLALDSLPDLLPAHVRELDVGENRLARIPSRWMPNLAILMVDGNEFIELDELPPALVELRASGCNLAQLPDLPDTLTELSVGENILTMLRLPPHLQALWASHNNLVRVDDWPDSLHTVHLNYNSLQSLPERLPQHLRLLEVIENELTALPEIPASLTALNFANNRVRNIPASLLNSPPECVVFASGNLLPDHIVESFDNRRQAYLNRSEMAPSATTHGSVAIHHSPLFSAGLARLFMARGRMTMTEAVGLWSLERLSDAQRQIWESSPGDAQQRAFVSFLERLFVVQHAQRDPAFRPQVAEWLRTLEQNDDLRSRCILRTLEASDSCEDGVALTWNNLQRETLAVSVAGATSQADEKNVILQAREFRILEILEGIAQQRINEVDHCDEVEVLLAYPTRLAGPLNLRTPTTTMRYRAPVDEGHLTAAREHVERLLTPTLFQRWLNNWEPWQSYLANCFNPLVQSMLALRYDSVNFGYYAHLVTQAEREHRGGADPFALSEYTYGGREADLRLNDEIFGPLTREKFGNAVMSPAGLPTAAPLHERIAHEIALPGNWTGDVGDIAPNVIGALYPNIRLIVNDLVISGAENGADAPVVRLSLEDNHYSPIIDGARRPVAENGDCFYASILYALTRNVPSDADIAALRLRVAEFVRSRPEIVAQAGLQSHGINRVYEPRHALSTDEPPGPDMPPERAFEEARRYLALALTDEKARIAGFAFRVGQLILRNDGVINEETARELFSEEFIAHAARAMSVETNLPKKSSQWRQGLLRAICDAVPMATLDELNRLEKFLFEPHSAHCLSLVGRALYVSRRGNPLMRDLVLIAPAVRAAAERRHVLSHIPISDVLAMYRKTLLTNKQARRVRWNVFGTHMTNIFSHLARIASDDPFRPYAIASLRQFSELELLPTHAEIERLKRRNKSWLQTQLRKSLSAPEDAAVQHILRNAQRDLTCPAEDFVRERHKLTINAAPGCFMSTVRGLFPLVMRETQQAFGPAGWTRLHGLYREIRSGEADNLGLLEFVGMIARGMIHPQDRANTLQFLIDQALWTKLGRHSEPSLIALRLVRDQLGLIPQAERQMLVGIIETIQLDRFVHGRWLPILQDFISQIRTRSEDPISVDTEGGANDEADRLNLAYARMVGRALHPFTLLDERILQNRARIAVAVEKRVRRLARDQAESVIPQVFENAGIRPSFLLVRQLTDQVINELVEKWEDRLCEQVRDRLEELYIKFFSNILDSMGLDAALQRYLLTITTTIAQTEQLIRTVAEHPTVLDDVPMVEPNTLDMLYDMYERFMGELANMVDQTTQTLGLPGSLNDGPLGPSGFHRQLERYSTGVLLNQIDHISMIEDEVTGVELTPVDQVARQTSRHTPSPALPLDAEMSLPGATPDSRAPSTLNTRGFRLYRRPGTETQSTHTPARREQSTQTPATPTAHVLWAKAGGITPATTKTLKLRSENRGPNAIREFAGSRGNTLPPRGNTASQSANGGDIRIVNPSPCAGSAGPANGNANLPTGRAAPENRNVNLPGGNAARSNSDANIRTNSPAFSNSGVILHKGNAASPPRNDPPPAENTARLVSNTHLGKRPAEFNEHDARAAMRRPFEASRSDSPAVQASSQPSFNGSNIMTMPDLREKNNSVTLTLTTQGTQRSGTQRSPRPSDPGHKLGGGKGAKPIKNTVPYRTREARIVNFSDQRTAPAQAQVNVGGGNSLAREITRESRVPQRDTIIALSRLAFQNTVVSSNAQTDSATRAVLAENEAAINKDAKEQAKALAKEKADQAQEEKEKNEEEEAEQARAEQRARDEEREQRRYPENSSSEPNFETEEERRKRRQGKYVYVSSPTHGDQPEAHPH